MLGVRHGVDLFRLVREAAEAEGDRALHVFCIEWLATRVPLMENIETQLAWFALRPVEAMKSAHPILHS